MEELVRMFRDSLFNSFYDWLEKNRDAVGEDLYEKLYDRAKEAEDAADNAIGVMAVAIWMLNMISGCGVFAGVGPEGYNLQYIENPKIDEGSTRRLLTVISACMNLQYLPPEEAKKPIPIISRKKFSLKLYVEEVLKKGK